MKWLDNWIVPWQLSRLGILGMNARNSCYIQRYNPRSKYPLVDDKLKTKKLALKSGLKVPPLYHVITAQHQIPKIHAALAHYDEFVMKPARGSGGNGILVICGRKDDHYVKVNDTTLSPQQLENYLSNVLSGLHSLGGQPDQIIVEHRIQTHPIFEDYSFRGVPDIRVLVFLGYPVMAMLRLSTSSSNGKANLHQGAIGLGLNLATGVPINAVQRGTLITKHPDTGHTFEKIRLPDWDNLLKLASGAYEVTGLGYLGVDMVLDKDEGPLILEMNARPGLSIQVANNAGLLPRLRAVEALAEKEAPVAERVKFSQHKFGQK
ncbi:MAG: alpha-L-glutamate ligase-like protein [Verrucomicrobia bacterium]|nr:alpha-L-glutamate ligase-like protein [Verrucomicrobiota bacterium]